jgi:general secretion pathway protein K
VSAGRRRDSGAPPLGPQRPAGVSVVRARRDGESGVALLVVLLAVTLLTVVVIELTYSAQVETHLALGARNALQATYLARSGINAAEAALLLDARGRDDGDSRHDGWAQPLPPLPVGDGQVAIRIRDEARALNLNMLSHDSQAVTARRREIFERLFDLLVIDRAVLAAIGDWIDADDEPWPKPLGAERSYYLGLQPPLVVRNGPLVTLRELLLVRGMTEALLARLDGFVTVLPPGEVKVNLNTAPPEVLLALSRRLAENRGLLDRLIAARGERPFAGDGPLKDAVPGIEPALTEIRDYATYGSTYFRIEAVGVVNDVTRGITAVVRRETGVRAAVTRVAWRPSVADLALTSQPPSDFLDLLPSLGGG